MILLDYTLEELQELACKHNQPRYRGEQLYRGLLQGLHVDEIRTLPKAWQTQLLESCDADQGVEIIDTKISSRDGTHKFLYRLYDDNLIEGVWMPHDYGNTLCVSTQVGCRMNCAFCASGLDGLVRNLSAGEILGQIVAVNRMLREKSLPPTDHVVLMGSGEPLDNYDAVTRFLRLVSAPEGLNLSRRNVSLSTCGLVDKIRMLADEGYTPTLTVSLHASNDEARRKIMPIARKYSIAQLLDACKYYFRVTGRRVIFEYTVIAGVNDAPVHAQELAKLLKGFACHVNLIGLNDVKERNLRGVHAAALRAFSERLQSFGVHCSIRRSMGNDIAGACGQLRRSHLANANNKQE